AKGRSAQSTAGNGPADNDIQRAAARALSRAHKLHSKADEVHIKAHLLHTSIAKVRQAFGKGSAKAVVHPSDAAEIVLDEKGAAKAPSLPIVGIGASAGGFEAFSVFISQLPSNLGMAFVLVQHLDPHKKSNLTQLLGHNTSVPVLQAVNDMEVKPDNI